MRLAIVGATLTLFIFVFPLVYQHVGPPAAALITVVVLFSAILLGVKGGLTVWALTVPLYIIEVTLVGRNGFAEAVENWPGILGTLILTIITGLFKRVFSEMWAHHQSEVKLNEERLRKINNCFLTFDASPDQNIKRLTSLTGELLGADAALYTRCVGTNCSSVGFTGTAEIDLGKAADEHGRWHAFLDHHSDGVTIIRNLHESPYRDAMPAAALAHPRTFAGKAVRIDSAWMGGLCVLFTADVKLGTAEKDLLGILASAITVEEKRKSAEDALTLNGVRMRSLLDTFPHIVWMKDIDGKFISVNQPFVETFSQRSIDDVLGKTDADVAPAELAEKYMIDDRRVISQGVKLETEEEIIDRGVKKWFETYKSPIYDAQGNVIGTAGFARDITDRKKIEHERRTLQAQLLQSQKIESIGTLAAGIAHDFNNILNIIVGNMELMANSTLDDKSARRVSAVANAADRAGHLVNQLLMFARKTDIHHIPLVINDIIDDTVKLISETFPKTILYTFDLGEQLPMITADPNQIHQVIMNLSVNARDAMPTGGTLGYATTMVPGSVVKKHFLQADAAAYVVFTVKDTGMGMDEATRGKIFDPFFTTKDAGKGTGLGMSVVQGIIHSHRGFIDVVSQPGAGTEIRVFLPASVTGLAAEAIAQPQSTSLLTGSETILLIEDEQLTRDIAEDLLISHGYTVISAGDGEEGVDLYARHHADVALIVSDFGLPKFTGEEVFRRIREVDGTVPFILISGYLEPEKRASLGELGILDIIAKPFKPHDLLVRIRQGLDA